MLALGYTIRCTKSENKRLDTTTSEDGFSWINFSLVHGHYKHLSPTHHLHKVYTKVQSLLLRYAVYRRQLLLQEHYFAPIDGHYTTGI